MIVTRFALATVCAACGGGSSTRIDASPGSAADARPDPGAPDAQPGAPADARPSTPGPDGAAADGVSDEFNGNSLSSAWNIIRGELLDISVASGELHLVANQYSVWFDHEVGGALWKGVAGDFKATTSVKARKASDPSQFVGAEYQFGGIIAYNPLTTDQHNYVFIVVGDRRGYWAVEVKSTVDSSSRVEGPDWGSGDAELRLCRVGSKFYLYKRRPGDTTWIEAITYDRPDLPGTLHVGPFAYAYVREPDLRASFDFMAIEPVSSANDCAVD